MYDVRGKLDGRYASFVQSSEKEALIAASQEAEDWLYTEEGEEATKSAYVEKLDGLKKLGDPVHFRWKESEERPKAAAALREVINTWMSLVQAGDDKYAHIADSEKEKVIEKCATNQKWLEDQLVRQSERAKNVDPIIASSEIYKRRDDVQFSSAGIMNRPKPKPKVETAPPSGTATPQNEPAKEEKADVDMDAQPEPEVQEMDVGESSQ